MPPLQLPVNAWLGERCFILGGGPSLTAADVNTIRGRGRVIAINNAWELAPWADMLYFADRQWWVWNAERLHAFPGRIVTRTAVVERDGGPWQRVEQVKRAVPSANPARPSVGAEALSPHPSRVAGWCGGANAINLAWALGCEPIVLLGFDGGAGNWHTQHQRETPEGWLSRHSRPALVAMANEMRRVGCESVVNCSRRTDLDCFRVASLEEICRED